jgi:hypothetical protein
MSYCSYSLAGSQAMLPGRSGCGQVLDLGIDSRSARTAGAPIGHASAVTVIGQTGSRSPIARKVWASRQYRVAETVVALEMTRVTLYELVWARPRSEVAKEFGISDVRLGKLCREMNVPAPPRGYWANLAGRRKRRKFAKPPLTYTVAERIADDHAAIWAALPEIDPKKLDEPIPLFPEMPSSVDDAVARYTRLIDEVPMPKSSRKWHPIAQRLIAEDERVAKLSNRYSWEQPKFVSPQGQKLLKGLNQLLWLFSDLGLTPKSNGTRHITMRVGSGQSGCTFEVTRCSEERGGGALRGKRKRYELWLDTEERERHLKKPALAFDAFDRATMRSVALLIVARWESGFRDAVKRSYDWRVEDRKRAIEEDRRARQHEQEIRARELKALRDSRYKLLNEAVEGSARSNQIRSLVEMLDVRCGSQGDQSPSYQLWRKWAMLQADTCDPRKLSLGEMEAWFSGFRLES